MTEDSAKDGIDPAVSGRLTDRASRIIALGENEAIHLDHAVVGTDHLLMGMLAEGENVAAQALTVLGVTMGTLRKAAGTRHAGERRVQNPRFGAELVEVLEKSLREALQLGHAYIGAEHMLLSLVKRRPAATGWKVLADICVDPDDVTKKVIDLLMEPYRRKEEQEILGSEDGLARQHWHTKRENGRVIYGSQDAVMIGVMDTPELAEAACAAHNKQRERLLRAGLSKAVAAMAPSPKSPVLQPRAGRFSRQRRGALPIRDLKGCEGACHFTPLHGRLGSWETPRRIPWTTNPALWHGLASRLR